MKQDQGSFAMRPAGPYGFPVLVKDGVARLRARYRIGEQQLVICPVEDADWEARVAQHDLALGPWGETLSRGNTLVRVTERGGRRHRTRTSVEVPAGVVAMTRSHLARRLEPSDLIAVLDVDDASQARLVQLDPDAPWFRSAERRINAAIVGVEIDASVRFAHVTFAARIGGQEVEVGWGRRPKTRSGIFAATPSGGMPAAPRHPVRRVVPTGTVPLRNVATKPATPFRRPASPTLVLERDDVTPERYRAHPAPPARLDQAKAQPPSVPLPASVVTMNPVVVPPPREPTMLLEHLWHDASFATAPEARRALRGGALGLRDLHATPDHDGDPPLALVEARVRYRFDARRELELTVQLMQHLGHGAALAKELAVAETLLTTPVEGARRVAAQVVQQVVDRWKRVGDDDLRQMLNRALSAERAYERVDLFGASHLAVELSDATSHAVAYLPAGLKSRLPQCAEFDARMLARVHPRQDATETSPLALCAVALARALPTSLA